MILVLERLRKHSSFIYIILGAGFNFESRAPAAKGEIGSGEAGRKKAAYV